MSEKVFKGVPRALVLDGWWMSADAQFEEPKSRPQLRDQWGSQTRRRLVLLFALLALADVLFFQQAIGISLAVFAIVIFAAAALEDDNFQFQAGPIVVLVLGLLPIVDYVQFFSVVFLVAGVIVSVAWQRFGVSHSLDGVLYACKRLAFYLPVGAVQSIDDWIKSPVGAVDVNSVFKGFVRNWAFPIGGGCLILSLLIAANPVLERVFSDLFDVDWDAKRLVTRVLFWLGMAFLVWPFLSVSAQRLQRPIGPMPKRRVFGFGLHAQSVSNALWVFNGLLFVQLIMDGAFAIGGDLPYGVGYAQYAHRGAYPLVATALLAGCFALAARPFLEEGRWLKPLMIVWLGLNGLLTISSMYRLGIYVDAYGLTYLRIRAAIWMVLIVVWLGLIAVQIIRSKANGWLVLRSFALGIGALYMGCFINFAEVISRHNAGHERFNRISNYSFCKLVGTSKTANMVVLRRGGCVTNYPLPEIDGWRDWGFREWRVARYVEEARAKGGRHENLGR
ncbi:DUF4173 domain-containing protein [Amylibacter sp. IMCC11727]|uniref:DUF4153 domain-containing protein n=1 Tax=Amylibacter sp. IMCC11727 TaxID=3039851 RepID=UPI00244E0A3A|nr:DUF4173 domain-containing protein [Amylibacter sp. IMCC11727]WGI21851.1 DUF4173 domain-containing protein [Amylibacter sp. IMCC11727]